MIDEFVPLQVIWPNLQETAIGSNTDEDIPHCNGIMSDSEKVNFMSSVSKHNMTLELWPSNIKPRNPSATLAKFGKHYVAVVATQSTRIVNYILLHRNQFRNDEEFAKANSITQEWFNVRIEEFRATRIHPAKQNRCDGELMRLALSLAIDFRPHDWVAIHENDLLRVCSKATTYPDPNVSMPNIPFFAHRESVDYFDASEIVVQRSFRLNFF